jgi:hypothetical protein
MLGSANTALRTYAPGPACRARRMMKGAPGAGISPESVFSKIDANGAWGDGDARQAFQQLSNDQIDSAGAR